MSEARNSKIKPSFETDQEAGDFFRTQAEFALDPSMLFDVQPHRDLATIKNRVQLEKFLTNLSKDVIFPMDFPVIQKSCFHTLKGEARELIELDGSWTPDSAFKSFAEASRRVGVLQLRRLRPLHDHRVLQRYLAAVESKQANGWHQVVYGLFLAIYSFPIAEGLLHYVEKTVAGLAQPAAYRIGLTHDQTNAIIRAQTTNALPFIEASVKAHFKVM